MNSEAQKKLQELVRKEVPALTPDEIAFIRSRSSYLTFDQKERYAEILGDGLAKGQSSGIDLKELKIRGEALGIKYKVGTKKEEYLKQIEEAEQAK